MKVRISLPIKVSLLTLLWITLSTPSLALSFKITSQTQRMVGTPMKVAELNDIDTFSSIAQKYDAGYYPLFEDNPGANPDNPLTGSVLIIPSHYILPRELLLNKNNILVNIAELRLYYYSKKEHKVYIYPVGIGREGWATPTGHFYVAVKIAHPTWVVPLSIRKHRDEIGQSVQKQVKEGPTDPLGKYALRLSNYSYLIHGTDDPVGVGRRSSAGCLRMYGKDIKELFHMVKKGTIVTIIDKPYKACFVNQKLYFEAHLPLYEQRIKYHGDITPALKIVDRIAKNHGLQVNKKQVLQFAKEHLGIPRILKTTKIKPKKKSQKKSLSAKKKALPKIPKPKKLILAKKTHKKREKPEKKSRKPGFAAKVLSYFASSQKG